MRIAGTERLGQRTLRTARDAMLPAGRCPQGGVLRGGAGGPSLPPLHPGRAVEGSPGSGGTARPGPHPPASPAWAEGRLPRGAPPGTRLPEDLCLPLAAPMPHGHPGSDGGECSLLPAWLDPVWTGCHVSSEALEHRASCYLGTSRKPNRGRQLDAVLGPSCPESSGVDWTFPRKMEPTTPSLLPSLCL